MHVRFWVRQIDPNEDGRQFLAWKKANFPSGGGGPRTYDCIMIDKQGLDTLQDEKTPAEDKFDAHGRSWVWMISSRKGEGTIRIGNSYLPRTWLILDACGWSAIWRYGNVVTPWKPECE